MILAGAVLAPLSLTVMTFNLRFATAPDGDNAWPHRRQMALDLIKKHDPDLLGVQEALASQVDELRAAFPEFDMVGVGRDDGLRKGEFSALFYRRSRLGLREGGTRWISATPDKPGSLGGTARIPRVFSWGEFFTENGTRILVMNAHLDHESDSARILGATQMLEWSDRRETLPCLIMGDFNATPESNPLRVLLESQRLSAARPASGPYVTFQGFNPAITEGDMIDHILFSREFRLEKVEIDRTSVGGRIPSDHYPVIARMTLP